MKNKQKILVLADDFGVTAPGMVFFSFVKELASRHEIDFFTINGADELVVECGAKSLAIHKPGFFGGKTKYLLSKYSITFFGFDIYSWVLARMIFRNMRKRSFDNVLILVSFNSYVSLLIGEQIYKNLSSKPTNFMVYFVDAIPAPPGWMKLDGFYKGLTKFISNRSYFIDAFFSSNKKMLDYQMSFFKKHPPKVSSVLYTPTLECGLSFPLPDTEKMGYQFLYTGGVYGRRSAKVLFEALKQMLSIRDDIYLVFVGTKFNDGDFSILEDNERAHVKVFPFVEDLSDFYKNSVALIDIDSDIDDDVFLSSKVIKYISINRFVISETANGSPARELFSNIDSIVICEHDCKQIVNAMNHVIKHYACVDCADRRELLTQFSASKMVDDFEEAMEMINADKG
jgi:hypothetical protein